MNLEESDVFKQQLERNDRGKKSVLVSIIFCTLLVVLLFILMRYIIYIDSITEKLYLDDKKISIPNNLYIEKDDDLYFNVKALGSLLGYTYTVGEYGEYNEKTDSCYLQNSFEIVALTAGANKYTKYIEITPKAMINDVVITAKNDNGYNESFYIEKPVIIENDMLYVSKDYVSTMFNVRLELNDEYVKKIYTLGFLSNYSKNVVSGLGFTEISGVYENIRALVSGYIILGDATEAKAQSENYGVITLTGDEVISKKYDEITFVQNTEHFYIKTEDGRVGIMDKEANNVIAPSDKFEEITLLNQENKIYLVRKGKEYGVVNGTGKIIIFPEQDEIGIDTKNFDSEDIENSCLLYNKCIPVKKDGNYGLYDLEGNIVLDCVYDGFGYISYENASSGNEESVLLIPSFVGVNGIVVNFNDKYGIYDVNVGLTVPTVFDKIYSRTKNGEITYYAEYNGEEMNLAEYLKSLNLNTVDEEGRLLSDLQATDQSQNNIGEDFEETISEQTEESSEITEE